MPDKKNVTRELHEMTGSPAPDAERIISQMQLDRPGMMQSLAGNGKLNAMVSKQRDDMRKAKQSEKEQQTEQTDNQHDTAEEQYGG